MAASQMLRTMLRILLVEDNLGDVMLVREALATAGVCHQLHVARDGEEAVKFLKRSSPFDSAPRPDVMILDLNLPRRTGREVMAELSKCEILRPIPVAVLTTSRIDHGIAADFPRLRCLYNLKTPDFQDLVVTVKQIERFAWADPWLEKQ